MNWQGGILCVDAIINNLARPAARCLLNSTPTDHRLHRSLCIASEQRPGLWKHPYIHPSIATPMDAAYELHRQQLIKAYNSAVKKKDWQAARNYRDELNILIAKKVALS